MKNTLIAAVFSICSVSAFAQADTANRVQLPKVWHNPYEPKSIITTISFGFADPNRSSFSVPAGYEKGMTTGFTPIYLKLEYGLGKNISLAASLSYSALRYNYYQLVNGWAGQVKRNKENRFSVLSEGIIAYYHLGNIIHVKHLDPFVGVGMSLNNIRHTAFPQGDSTIEKTDFTVSPYIKAGARYFLSDKCSIFGDVGYDNQSVFSLGFTCRFFRKP